MSIYDITVLDTECVAQPMRQYEGKVLLIANTATKCGFTPQYWGLEKLYKKYNARGFEVLDFPCNQFMNQAPGGIESISEQCKIKYGTTFPRFSKVDVNGQDAHPLFVHLKSQAAGEADDAPGGVGLGGMLLGVLTSRTPKGDIKWNFTKFLVDRKGNVVKRFGPTVKPEEIDAEIARLI